VGASDLVTLHSAQRTRLLDDIMKIPIATHTLAIRVAGKYSMDNVQDAIVRVVNSLPSGTGIRKAIAQLAFVADLSGHLYT
jgi:hypothetical protein